MENAEQPAQIDGHIEEWAQIVGFEGTYSVSNFGRVRSDRRQRMLTPRDNGHGYMYVSLGRGPHYYVHRLVGVAFVPNPNHYTEIDHITNRRDLNYAWLLRWVSREQNMRNKSHDRNGEIEYIQQLPEGSIPVQEYKGHRFEGLYIHDGNWYRFNGVRFQKLRLILNSGTYCVNTVDVDGQVYTINTAQYRISIGDVPTERERPRNPDSVLPHGAIGVGQFNGWIFDGYYWHDGLFYKDTGTEYKPIHPRIMTGKTWRYAGLADVHGRIHNVGVDKFLRSVADRPTAPPANIDIANPNIIDA